MPRPQALKTYNQFAFAMSGNARSFSKSRSGAFQLTPVVIANTALLLLTAVLLVYYVVSANAIAADTYKIKSLKEEAASLIEENSLLVTEKTRVEDPSSLAEFARTHQMVEAKDVTYLFENGSVALGGN